MSSKREIAKEEAIRKIQEADLWWNRFHQSVNEWRIMTLCHASYGFQIRLALHRRLPNSVLAVLQRKSDYAHDMIITLRENVDSLSRSAVSCEMAHRIHMEEFEQRHWEGADE